MNICKIRQLFTVVIATILVASWPSAVLAETSAKYLVFHLDAISTDLFVEQRDSGKIPNIEAFFAEGTTVLGGLSLWPGGTEMIYPRLKSGYSNAEHPFVGWRYLDAKEGRWVINAETLPRMFFGYPRRSRAFSIYAHPPALDFLAGMSIKNVPFLLQQYDVVEVLWFSSDHAGHVSGPEAQLASLYRFDDHFGKLIEAIDLSHVNVVLYSDHGMTYPPITDPESLVLVNKIVAEVLGDALNRTYYPHVYLHDPMLAPQIARTLMDNMELDWTIYRADEHTLIGLNPAGWALWHEQEERVGYFVQEGPDPFEYDSLGYQGEYLTKDEWLALTVDSFYPGAVPNVWGLSENANSGDVLMVINPPSVVCTLITNTHNHKGLGRTDLLVPLLFRGPDLGHMEDVENMWLHELYSHYVPGIPFDRVPMRDRHHFDLRIPYDGRRLLGESSAEVRFSPEYRINFGSRWQSGTWDFYAQYDVFSTFLTRWWLGVGLRYSPQEGDLSLGPHLEGDWQYGRWGASVRLDHFEDKWNIEPTVRYYSSDWAWSLELTLGRVGLRHYW